MRVYFDDTTFVRITKDDAAKFVNMLSAIVGLPTDTGLVEILYFGFKIFN